MERTAKNVLERFSGAAPGAPREGARVAGSRTVCAPSTEQISQLVISRAISGLRIEER